MTSTLAERTQWHLGDIEITPAPPLPTVRSCTRCGTTTDHFDTESATWCSHCTADWLAEDEAA
jgi:hypothetical protein